jgi:hypothetical protein
VLTQRAPYILAAGITLLAVAIIAVAVLTGGGGGKSSGPKVSTSNATPAGTPVDTAPSTSGGTAPATAPDIALANYVQTTFGKAFVMDCTKADPAKDAGKICATAKGDRGTQKAFQIGPVGAPPNGWLIVDNNGGPNWNVVLNQPITPDNSTVPGVPWPLKVGVDLVVVGSGSCVNVRVGPSLGQSAVDCIKDGTKIQLAAGPTVGDNITWWQVTGRTGWVAADYLRYPDAAQ